MDAALFSPLARRAGIGYWSYLLPEHLADLQPGGLAAVPFSGQILSAVLIEREPDVDPEEELKPAVGEFRVTDTALDFGAQVLRLHREFGAHPAEAARWLGLGGNRPLFREFFFAPSPAGCSTHSIPRAS